MHIITDGDGPILDFLEYRDQQFALFVSPKLPATPRLWYNQAAISLKGMATKMGQAGYGYCVVGIATAEDEQPMGHLWFGL